MGSTILAALSSVAFLFLMNGPAPTGSGEPPGDAPELVVSILPAVGILPADGSDEFAPYRFEVSAGIGQGEDRLHVTAQTLVRPGQAREADRVSRGARVHGSVKLHDNGLASYKAELIVDGKSVARTSAMVNVGRAGDEGLRR
ncbi:MAG TPA: hypothetical protein VIA45_14580 [Thermoanaerobaculia bacterium]|jgi:hypothetical protein